MDDHSFKGVLTRVQGIADRRIETMTNAEIENVLVSEEFEEYGESVDHDRFFAWLEQVGLR